MDLEQLKKIKYWGAATSAHQVEGKTHNQWTVWELEHAAELAKNAETKYAHWLPRWNEIKEEASQPENYVSGIAVDHYERYEEDFDLAQQLNLNSLRISIEWSRVEPREGEWDEAAIEHYKEVLMALKRRGIEPFVTLWHWTMPIWFVEKGAFERRTNIKYFLRFTEKIAIELKAHVNYIITINEPNVYVGLGYRAGVWPPQKRSLVKFLFTFRNLLTAHKQAYDMLKKIKGELSIGIAVNANYSYPGDRSWLSRSVARFRNWGWNWVTFDRLKSRQDFIGINYYQSDRIFGFKTHNPDAKQSDLGWNMEPAHIEFALLEAKQRYNKPVIVTENGLADAKDQNRQWWLEETLKGMSAAIKRGARIDGYLHWSLMDNFEWADGFWPRFGLIEVDRGTLTRKVRPSAEWFGGVVKQIKGS